MSQFYENPKEPEEKGTAPAGEGKRRHGSVGRRPGKGPTWFFPGITGKKRIGLYAYTALTVFAAIIVVGYIAFEAFSAPPVVETNPPRPPQTTTTTDPEGNEIEILPNPDITGPSSDRKDQFYTFLLVGQSQEEGGNLTDTMMLAAYDVPNQTLNVMSIPRDIYVRRNNKRYLINSIYNIAGEDGLKEEVTKLTGIPVDFFVMVKWEAFGELVDAIGGVWYDVPRDMKYKDPEQDLYINVSKGYQFLDGDKAMQVVRFREGANGYIDGDLGRIRTQQGFMKEVVKKCLQPDVLLGNLAEYIEIFQKNVTTDLTAQNLTYFGKSAIGGLNMDNVSFITMPNKPASNGHLYPDGDAIVEVVNAGFNPYREDIKPWELRVESASTVGPTPTPKPTNTPAPTPTPEETPGESETPESSESPEPSGSVRPTGSSRPTSSPRPTQSEEPDHSESPSPSPEETDPSEPLESQEPTVEPSEEPTQEPSDEPTQEPTEEPSDEPTQEPTPTSTPEEAPPILPTGPVG